MSYDALNRVTYKNYHDPLEINVQYTYDRYDDYSTTNVIGRLAKVTDASGSTVQYYDKQGRVIKTVRAVDGIPYTVETDDRDWGQVYFLAMATKLCCGSLMACP
jgi:YD repeat-containing protein